MTKLTGLKLQAIVVDLVDRIVKHGGWCGETHIQKSTYFLKALTEVPVDYEFIMYKHGPYSFDLHDELVGMKANGFLKTEPQGPYGPSFQLGDFGRSITSRFPKTLSQYGNQIEFVAEEFSNKGVVELERLATALFVSSETSENQTVEERAHQVNQLKPHITIEVANITITQIDKILDEARQKGLALTS